MYLIYDCVFLTFQHSLTKHCDSLLTFQESMNQTRRMLLILFSKTDHHINADEKNTDEMALLRHRNKQFKKLIFNWARRCAHSYPTFDFYYRF